MSDIIPLYRHKKIPHQIAAAVMVSESERLGRELVSAYERALIFVDTLDEKEQELIRSKIADLYGPLKTIGESLSKMNHLINPEIRREF